MQTAFRVLVAALLIGLAGGSAGAITIAEAKQLPNTSYVSLPGKTVTCTGTDFFYIEDDSRAGGIRVRRLNHTYVPGMRLNVNGYLATNEHFERYLTNC